MVIWKGNRKYEAEKVTIKKAGRSTLTGHRLRKARQTSQCFYWPELGDDENTRVTCRRLMPSRTLDPFLLWVRTLGSSFF